MGASEVLVCTIRKRRNFKTGIIGANQNRAGRIWITGIVFVKYINTYCTVMTAKAELCFAIRLG